MTSPDRSTASLWVHTSPSSSYAPLAHDASAEVCVIGGGMTGLLTAKLLADEGVSVVLLEASRICSGVTGSTTAKVTSQHRAIYDRLRRHHGEDVARIYADAQGEAVHLIARLAAGIPCDLRRVPSYVTTEMNRLVPALEQEAATARGLGLPATFTTETDLPYRVAGAVRFDEQAVFHPRKFCLGLADDIVESGATIAEGTRAVGAEESAGRCVVRCEDGTSVEARAVVLATQTPFLYRGLFFARTKASRSYVVASRCDRDVDGMYISLEKPTRSIRTHRTDEGPVLIVGGEEHATGAEQATGVHYHALEAFARNRFGITDAPWRWSAQDFSSGDGLPYVGPVTKRRPRTYVATGFDKWGMTNAAAAARAICDSICGRHNDFARITDASRTGSVRQLPTLVDLGTRTAKSIVLDRITIGKWKRQEHLLPGEAAVVRHGRDPIAAFRDDAGVLHAVRAVCTHLSCIVRFNDAERSWECPCHGSRFDIDGRVLNGPAIRDLEPVDIETEVP